MVNDYSIGVANHSYLPTCEARACCVLLLVTFCGNDCWPYRYDGCHFLRKSASLPVTLAPLCDSMLGREDLVEESAWPAAGQVAIPRAVRRPENSFPDGRKWQMTFCRQKFTAATSTATFGFLPVRPPTLPPLPPFLRWIVVKGEFLPGRPFVEGFAEPLQQAERARRPSLL